MRLLTVLILAPLVLIGCAGIDADPTKDWTVERFYEEAKTALNEGNFATAAKHFETLEARYPYGPYAEQAQLEVGYAYYKEGEAASAIAAADRFVRLHPTHPSVDYAYYLKGLAALQDPGTFLGWLRGNQDLADREPKLVREAYDAFRELVTRFPSSRYAPDATARMNELVLALARHELKVAEYYLSRGAHVAAANRAKFIIENYQRSPAVEDALAVQAKAYKAMGLSQLMQDTLRVLEQNFPGSHYLQELRG